MSAVDVRMFTVGPVQENSYLLRTSAEADHAIIVDPGEEADKLLAAIAETGVTLDAILLTHTHFDHVGAVAPVARATGAPVYCPALETQVLADIMAYVPWEGFGPYESWNAEQTVAGGERLQLAGFDIDVHLHARPQPRPRDVRAERTRPGCRRHRARLRRRPVPGLDRPHRPAGRRPRDAAALDRRTSPARYDDETVVLPGHMGVTTIGRERQTNPFLQDLPARAS